ncbi:MAG: pantothenate kinase [Nodosilinea sp.]
MASDPNKIWLGLVIGNSRLHWGLFSHDRWLGGWHTPHLDDGQTQILKAERFSAIAWQHLGFSIPLPQFEDSGLTPELWVASVVRPELDKLIDYPALYAIETSRVPLRGMYPTLGVDRALALLGAGLTYGWPVLVIDGGTALSFTAGAEHGFIGGAILPGLGLQFKALHRHTDQLPDLQPNGLALPYRWATNTAEAMASGIIYSQLAGIRDFIADWWQRFPLGQVIFTGGDGETLAATLAQVAARVDDQIKVDPNLMFWGLRACRQRSL